MSGISTNRFANQLLRTQDEVIRRRARIHEVHVRPLTQLVYNIRFERLLKADVPYFDPSDGGVNAEVLFVLEAPGPKAVCSGFVSCDNPDPTAANFKSILAEAEIDRCRIAIWNIVPWYLGENGNIRHAKAADLEAGRSYLERLIILLPNLKAVVMVGRRAQHATRNLTMAGIKRFECAHPSAQVLNPHPHKRIEIVNALIEARGNCEQV